MALTRPPAGDPPAGAPGSRLPVPATNAGDEVAEAIVVPNALWTPVDGEAYGGVPLDEILFFMVIPLAAILTLEAVRSVRGWKAGDEA